VQSPYTPRAWGGDGASIGDLYDLPASGYNPFEVSSVETALETAGEESEVFPNPWAFVANVAINTIGTYLAYKSKGMWFHWLSNQWGEAVSGQTNGCTASATALTSNCQLWRVRAGTTLCIGYKGVARNVVTWTVPSDGLLLAGNTTNLFTSSFSGPCSGYSSWNPVALPSSFSTAIAAVNSSVGSTFEGDTGLAYTPGNDFMIWFQPISGTWAGGAHPPGFPNDNIQPYSTQPIPAGDLGSHTGTPTVKQIADALRSQLTDPSDTCAGSPCPWGDNGGTPGAKQTHHNSWTFSCLISGTCSSTALSPSFTMPDCYGMSLDGCELTMEQLGFTGTLVAGTATDADYTLPAGAVVSTVPAAGFPEPTTADQRPTAYENPQSCTWDVQNPHGSTGSPGLIDVKATATCTYQTTVIGNLKLWKCDEQPSPDLAELETGAWGCLETQGTVVNDSRLAEPDQQVVFQVPPPQSGIEIAPDGKYFIAYGACDQCTPSSKFSNVVGPLN
jgi:hypothetical protein